MNGRRKFLIGAAGLGAVGAAGYWFGLRPMLNPEPPAVGFDLSADELAAARAFMNKHPVVDSHAHPGRSFLRGAENLSTKIRLYKLLGGTFEDRTLADMQEGGMAAAVFNGVADIQLLTLGDSGLIAERDYSEGEAWASYERQIASLHALEAAGKVSLCLTADDIRTAHSLGKTGAVLAMEGADFLEADLSRLQRVKDDGVRMLTLVHYHDNSLGDIVTGPGGTRGLTDFGRDVVVAMNQAGLMIDLSHASEQTVMDVLAVTTKPAVLTHTHINSETLQHPRFVSGDVARAVSQTGGYIGAWPVGIGQTTLAEFVDRIDFLVETVGDDHVAMGSDMDANYKPVLETYRKMPLVVGALLKRGYSEDRLARIMGGNVLRVMEETQSA